MGRLFVMVLALLIASTASAVDLGTVGTTYAIAEKDALAEIEQRAGSIDWRKLITKKSVEEYDGPQDRVSLPRAARDRQFPVDMTWTLQIDVPDGRGGILYPKGYTFNPLDYVAFTRTLVVIDGNDPEQVKWFAASEYKGRIDVMLLLMAGPYRRLGNKLDISPFYADGMLVERLHLEAVPSVVRQEGKVMVIREFNIPRKNGENTGKL
jgi:conjugal transfer pilus assembly protein TraW